MSEFLYGGGIVLLYFVIAASTAFLLRGFVKIPNEIFRKGLHFLLLFSYLPFAFAFETWWISVLAAVVLGVLVYPALALAERIPGFTAFTTERKHGELKRSMVLAFGMLAFCNTVCWGLLGDKCLTLACMYAWGVGDAFAALIGKKYGKHKIKWKFADGRKSVEGSCAMFVTSAIAVAFVLLAHNHLTVPAYIVIPLAGAGAATLVEMTVRDGNDSIYCPMAAMAVMLPLMALFGGF